MEDTVTITINGNSKKEIALRKYRLLECVDQLIKLVKSETSDNSKQLNPETEIDKWFYGLTADQQAKVACNLWKELSFRDKKEANYEE